MRLGCAAIRSDAAEDSNLARLALCEKQITVWGSANQPRIIEFGGIKSHLETGRTLGPGVCRPINHVTGIVRGERGKRCR